MKKFLLFNLALFFSFSSFAQTKVGTIDAEYILNQLPEMEQVQADLKTYNQELQQELKGNVQTYDSLVTDYQANKATFTPEEKKEKESQIISLENDIKGFRQKASVMMQMRRNKLTKPLYDRINTAMMAVIEAENYTQILHRTGNALAFSAEQFDITKKVLKKLGIKMEVAEKQ